MVPLSFFIFHVFISVIVEDKDRTEEIAGGGFENVDDSTHRVIRVGLCMNRTFQLPVRPRTPESEEEKALSRYYCQARWLC